MDMKIVCEKDEWGNEKWYRNNKLHREDGPAIIAGNYMEWRRDGLRHREDGPSLIMDNGRREWWFNAQLHCGSGPAVIWSTGFLEWWINGIQLNATLVEQWMKLKDISWPFDEETEAEFLLTWA